MKGFKKYGFFCFFFLIFFLFTTQNSYADKSSATISAPETAVKGTEVTVKLTITHNGNNFFHYTNRVTLKMNGKEISRWEFTGSKKPETEVFSREIKITINEPVELIAEANCNMHGSKGPVSWKIAVK